MSEIARLKARLSQLQSLRSAIQQNISGYQAGINKAHADLASAGCHTDAYERQQRAQRTIKDLQSSVASAEQEIRRIDNQIRGIELEIRSPQ